VTGGELARLERDAASSDRLAPTATRRPRDRHRLLEPSSATLDRGSSGSHPTANRASPPPASTSQHGSLTRERRWPPPSARRSWTGSRTRCGSYGRRPTVRALHHAVSTGAARRLRPPGMRPRSVASDVSRGVGAPNVASRTGRLAYLERVSLHRTEAPLDNRKGAWSSSSRTRA
jgi:hypothetical protein